jgi:hypothetical protein
MTQAGLWRAKKQKIKNVHVWRPRRSCRGELVQWDTSEHDWLEGRGEKLYLISMIDDATSKLLARFVRSDSTQESMRLLWTYLECNGRRRRFTPTRRACSGLRRKSGATQRPCQATSKRNCRLRKSGGLYRNRKSFGSPRTARKRKDASSASSARHKTGSSKGMRLAGITTLDLTTHLDAGRQSCHT